MKWVPLHLEGFPCNKFWGRKRLAYVVYAGVVFFLLKKDIILEDFSSKS